MNEPNKMGECFECFKDTDEIEWCENRACCRDCAKKVRDCANRTGKGPLGAGGFVIERCCYVGCRREFKRYIVSGFPFFDIWKCEGRIFCSNGIGDCPWHPWDPRRPDDVVRCNPDIIFGGNLCPEHYELFLGDDFRDTWANIAKADPELFDRSRPDTYYASFNYPWKGPKA